MINMRSLTKNEKKALLALLKDYTTYHNSLTLSKVLKISHAGTYKLLKNLDSLTQKKTIGKAIIHKPRLDDPLNRKLFSFLLAEEASRRWQDEFGKIFKNGRIILIFGSAIKSYMDAKDIDIMVVLEKEDTEEVRRTIRSIEKLLPKKVHDILLTKQDLKDNLKKKENAFADIIRNAIVLYGEDDYLEAIKGVTGF